MIFHLPVKQELIDTSVDYVVDLYDENKSYNDGDEVRKDDDIYIVTNKAEHIEYPNFQDFKYYAQGDKVTIDGAGYQKVAVTFDVGCWSTLNSATSGVFDRIFFRYWDGVTFDTEYTVDDDNTPCEDGVTFTFKDKGKVDNYRNVTVAKKNTSNNIITVAGKLRLYDEIVPSATGCFIRMNGRVSKLFGTSKEHVVGEGLSTGEWIKLERNYNVKNTHVLTYLRPSIKKVPFDTKQYTSVTRAYSQTWHVKTPNGCNAVVLGNVVAETIEVQAFDSSGDELTSKATFIPFSYLDATVEVGETLILYLNVKKPVARISVLITRDFGHGNTRLGMIMPTFWQDVGATNLQFSNAIKNFDKNKISEVSGYIEHIRGNRVIQHRGSFDIPLQDYDKTVRLNKQLTQELIAIDGSDNIENQRSNSISIFASTQLIGRVKSLTTATTTTRDKNKIDDFLKVTFEFEEIV